MKEVGSLN
jgi:hypothetical protein